MAELQRTQMYLTRDEIAELEKRKDETGISVSELVRRAVDRAYLGRARRSRDERLAIARETAGAWGDRGETGADYAERLRSGRLARLRVPRA